MRDEPAKRFSSVFIVAWALDRAAKRWALSHFASLPYRKETPAFLSLGLYFNRGISFSLLEDHPYLSLTMALTTVGFLGLLCAKSKTLRSAPGIAFLWAGATGNLTDRLWYGYVIDWIYVFIGYINLADIWLCVGGAAILFRYLKKGRETPVDNVSENQDFAPGDWPR